MKRFLVTSLAILLVAAALLLSVPTANAVVYEGTCGENIEWSFDYATYALTIGGTGAIPDYTYSSSEMSGSGITAVTHTWTGRPWLTKQNESSNPTMMPNSASPTWAAQIQTLVVSEGITSIGDYAFHYIKSLTSATLPSTLQSVGESAFADCAGLTSITIPASVTVIEEGAFTGLAEGSIIYINASNANLLTADVHYDSARTTVEVSGARSGSCGANVIWTLVDDVLTISGTGPMEDYAAEFLRPYCGDRDSVVTRIVVEEGVTHIGETAFAAFDALQYVEVAESVTSIGAYAFASCQSLLEVCLEGRISSVGSSAFIHVSEDTTIWMVNPSILEADVHYSMEDAPTVVASWYALTIYGLDGNVLCPTTYYPWDDQVTLPTLPEGVYWSEGGALIEVPYYSKYMSDVEAISLYPYCSVTWCNWDGTTLYVDKGIYGGSFSYPSYLTRPSRDGCVFVGWDADLSCIQSSTITYPLWAILGNVVDTDEEVNIADAARLLEVLVDEIYSALTNVQEIAADVNGDDEIDIADVALILEAVSLENYSLFNSR